MNPSAADVPTDSLFDAHKGGSLSVFSFADLFYHAIASN